MVNIATVDDNKAFLQEMKQNIEACKEFTADMVCDTYCSGADFLQSDRGAYQLAILDMQMAGMGGYETVRKLREKNENAVIAFVSRVVLPEPEHFRVHTSYIVNLKAVTKIMRNELTMSNGDRLRISRTCSKKFHQSFTMYFHKKYKRGAKE